MARTKRSKTTAKQRSELLCNCARRYESCASFVVVVPLINAQHSATARVGWRRRRVARIVCYASSAAVCDVLRRVCSHGYGVASRPAFYDVFGIDAVQVACSLALLPHSCDFLIGRAVVQPLVRERPLKRRAKELLVTGCCFVQRRRDPGVCRRTAAQALHQRRKP
jgi:hypothetical protein